MRFFTRLFAVIGFMVVLGIVLVVIGVASLRHRVAPLPKEALLTLTIDGALEEKPGFDPLNVNHQLSMSEALRALRTAKDDGRIKGVFINIADNLPLAQSQELHDALDVFRGSGKPIYAFADTFGEQGPGAAEYYLATAANKIWLQPMGTVGLTGISADELFLKDVLARNGVEFQASKREQYKTAFDNMTENGFTPANREMTNSLLQDIVDQLVSGIAQSRKLDSQAVRAAMDTGPLSADQAKAGGFVDKVDYRQAALDDLEDETDTDDTVSVHRYLGTLKEPVSKNKIAIIYADGELARHTGVDPLDPLSNDQASDPRDVVSAFRQASDDDDVKAIVFRINSPGGSVVASETIRSGVLSATDPSDVEKQKPVIVSMGEVAGSGGYWIAADADQIIAEPATLTGSIGVLGGKPVLQKLLQDHGVVAQDVHIGQNSTMDSPYQPFTPEQEQKQNAMLDDIYGTFKGIVAEGRELTPERVEELAKGRVYTGRQAKDLGLVDELGGLETAILRAREAAGLASSPVQVVQIPKAPTIEEFLRSMFSHDDSDDDDDARTPMPFARIRSSSMALRLRPYLNALLAEPGDRTVAMPPIPRVQ